MFWLKEQIDITVKVRGSIEVCLIDLVSVCCA